MAQHQHGCLFKSLFCMTSCNMQAQHATSWVMRTSQAENGCCQAQSMTVICSVQVRNYMPAYKQVLDGEWNIAQIAKE